MPNDTHALQEARQTLIRLFENDDWKLTDRADAHGRAILAERGGHVTQYDIILFVLNLLKTNYPMHPVKLGEPPGSGGLAYVMNNADKKGLYIKLKIEDGAAWVMSF